MIWSAFLAAALAAPSPEADRKVFEGLESGYSLDFAGAALAFSEAERLDPAHPAGPFFQGALTWLEFSLNHDAPGSAESLEPRFESQMARARERAEGLLRGDPASAEAYFYLGAIHGMRGRWRILKRQWVRAAADGYRGRRHLARALELDPSFYDAYLGLGMYEYYTDKLPSVFKIASLGVARGDKEKGLRLVRTAIANGRYSVKEAQLFLAGIYMAYEKEPRKALEIIADLRLESPGNLFFRYAEVAALIHAQDWPRACVLAETLAADARAAPATASLAPLFDVYLADAYLGAGDYPRAREAADRCAAQSQDPHRATVTYCLLRRAQALDLMGERSRALEDYRLASERPDYWGSREKARRGLAGPADRGRVVAELLE